MLHTSMERTALSRCVVPLRNRCLTDVCLLFVGAGQPLYTARQVCGLRCYLGPGGSSTEGCTATKGDVNADRDAAHAVSELPNGTVLVQQGWAYEEDVGGGAFYGPKIDIKICDAIGRKWQCSTVQVGGGKPTSLAQVHGPGPCNNANSHVITSRSWISTCQNVSTCFTSGL